MSRGSNRGPAAAAENRLALIHAAQRLFAERGYHVPLSAIAREAGVGQAVLYRHFPTRLDLAFAVFEDNFTDLEAIAADPEPTAFHRLWARLVDLTIDAFGFVEMVVDARRTLADYEGTSRLEALVGSTLTRAQDAGRVDAHVTTGQVMLAVRMVYGVVATSPEPARAREDVEQAMALLGGWVGGSRG